MTGLLVAVVMLLFVCVPSSALWADTAPGLQNRVAQADNSQIVPPDPEQPAEAPAASSAVDAAAEVLRLRDLIGEKRDEIEAGRSAALEQVEATYRANLAAIEPKDMFETELEYQQRDAREKSEVELQRAQDVSDVHREHDLALRDEVEPMVQQVRELLSRDDIVPADAIDSHLENYDPERKVFTGTLKIDSALVQTNAQFYLPMKRDKARVLWQSRTVLQGKVRVSMNVRSLDIGIEEFWLEDPESGNRTEERIAVVEIRHPGERAASQEHRKDAMRFAASASALAERSARGARHRINDPFNEDQGKVKGWIAEYNRLVDEAKSVFAKDPHVQALKTLTYGGSNFQAAGAVTTASSGLAVYLTSFVSNDALKSSASALAERSARGASDRMDPFKEAPAKVKGWIAEYNRLVDEAKSVFAKDPHVQALKTLIYGGSNSQAAGAVTTASSGLAVYLTSFVSNDALKSSASALAERSARGARHRINDPFNEDQGKVKGWIAEYNRLVDEAKSVFAKDPHVQALKTLIYGGSNSQAAGAVTTASSGLAVYLTSFVSNDAFKSSASALAERSARGASDRMDPFKEAPAKVKGWIAEYNRLVDEAKSVFAKDPHVQALKTLTYGGSNSQAAGAVKASAERLRRVMTTAKALPREAVAEVTDPGYTPLDYLPYSGRFSSDTHKLANLLGRAFSPDARDENGWTDLSYAAVLNLPGLVSALLDAGADPNAKVKSDGKSVSNRCKSILSQFGINAEAWTRSGGVPLHAAWLNDRSVTANLIVHGAKIDAKTVTSWTPLHLAAFRNALSAAELLIGQGADIRAKTENGWTPLDTAIEAESSEAEALLRRHEAPCNKKCS